MKRGRAEESGGGRGRAGEGGGARPSGEREGERRGVKLWDFW